MEFRQDAYQEDLDSRSPPSGLRVEALQRVNARIGFREMPPTGKQEP